MPTRRVKADVLVPGKQASALCKVYGFAEDVIAMEFVREEQRRKCVVLLDKSVRLRGGYEFQTRDLSAYPDERSITTLVTKARAIINREYRTPLPMLYRAGRVYKPIDIMLCTPYYGGIETFIFSPAQPDTYPV